VLELWDIKDEEVAPCVLLAFAALHLFSCSNCQFRHCSSPDKIGSTTDSDVSGEIPGKGVLQLMPAQMSAISLHSVEYSELLLTLPLALALILVLVLVLALVLAVSFPWVFEIRIISACTVMSNCCNLTSKQLSSELSLVEGVFVLLLRIPPLFELVLLVEEEEDLLVKTDVSRLSEAESAAVAPPCKLSTVPTNPDGKLCSGNCRGSSL